MSRFSHYDTDEERLPSGMERIGYDADTQTYTYRDARGKIYEGAPGAEYGHLSPTGGDDDGEGAPFISPGSGGARPPQQWEHERDSWRAAWAPLLNFFLLVALFLAGVGWLLYGRDGGEARVQCGLGEKSWKIHKGNTCWELAQGSGIEVDRLKEMNPGMDCDRLRPGSTICLPDEHKKEVGDST